MPLICTPPGGSSDPLQQSRKVGVFLRLSDIFESRPDKERMMGQVADALKEEFLNQISNFLLGYQVPIVRSLGPTEYSSINDKS
jgi:hypothetical protein